MTAYSTRFHSHPARLPAWLAAALVLIALGGTAPSAARAGEQPASSGAAIAYVGQGWG